MPAFCSQRTVGQHEEMELECIDKLLIALMLTSTSRRWFPGRNMRVVSDSR